MCEDEFNSIHYPVGMYPQDYDWSATVSRYLIAATSDFSLHYLMPVPDFFASARPAPVSTRIPAVFDAEDGVFQSRRSTNGVYCTRFEGSSLNPVPIAFATDAVFSSGCFTLDVEVTLTRISGSTDCFSYAQIGKSTASVPTQPLSNSTTALPSTIMCIPLHWTDVSGTGRYTAKGRSVKSFANLGGSTTLTVGYDSNDGTSVWRYDFIINVAPWDTAVMLLNSSDTAPRGLVSFFGSQADVRVINTSALPVPVNIQSTSSNLPVDVASPSVLNVSVVNPTLNTLVVNPDSNPVHVDWNSDASLTARVQGIASPDTPVWVSGYQ